MWLGSNTRDRANSSVCQYTLGCERRHQKRRVKIQADNNQRSLTFLPHTKLIPWLAEVSIEGGKEPQSIEHFISARRWARYLSPLFPLHLSVRPSLTGDRARRGQIQISHWAKEGSEVQKGPESTALNPEPECTRGLFLPLPPYLAPKTPARLPLTILRSRHQNWQFFWLSYANRVSFGLTPNFVCS